MDENKVVAALIGMLIVLIPSLGINWYILSQGEQAGLVLILTIPISCGLILAGAAAGQGGYDIAGKKFVGAILGGLSVNSIWLLLGLLSWLA